MGRKWGSRGEPVALRLPATVLAKVDKLVHEGKFRSRTEVFDEAIAIMLRQTVWNWNKQWIEKVHIDDKNDAIISIRLRENYVKYLDELVAGGAFKNRSEVIKTALLRFLPDEPEKQEG